MKPTLLRCFVALLLIGFGLFWHKPAHAAISCTSAAMSAVTFGNVDPQSTQTDANATLSYRCSNTTGSAYSATICFSIGEPGGGPTNPRQMHDTAGDALNFQLYQDPARSIIWGSQFFGSPTPMIINITLASGASTSGTRTMYGRVIGGQTMAVPASYTDQYNNVDTAITINQATGNTPPGSCSVTTTGPKFPFLVSATVVKKCTVTASTLSFGSIGLLTAAIPGTTTLGVQCSNTTPYDMGLDAGQNSGGNINARKMVLGANSVAYQLYRDPGRTQVWGNTIGTNTVAGTGTGITQNLTVYGNVPAQPTPPAGTYSDTVVVTVTY